MIQAYFQTSGATNIPALVPNDEVLELAAMAGLTAQDLFRIDIPGGASREGRVLALVPQSQLNTLYASTASGPASATFYWAENDAATSKSLGVWLLPPRPLFMVPGGSGIAIVEAVDVRYWWKQTQLNARNASPAITSLFSSDGRWNVGGYPMATSLSTILDDLRLMLPVGTFTSAAFAPSSALRARVNECVFTPEMSIAMALDVFLSALGYALVYDNAGGYGVATIQSNQTALQTFMTSNKRASVGGIEAPSGTPATTEPLMNLWAGNANWQVNRMPGKVTVSFPYRSIEGKTYYNNALPPPPTDCVQFATKREFGWEQNVSTVRSRTNTNAVRVIKEPQALVASLNTTLNPASPATNIQTGIAMPFNYADYVAAVTALYVKRCEVTYGKTVWAGWPSLPNGAYRVSMYRFTLGVRSNELVPITLSAADMDDWILGPNGMTPDDPKDIVMSKGLAHARRLGNGMLQIDVAPPYCRVFLAKITGSEGMGEGATWRWLYSYEEKEPNPDANNPIDVTLGAWARVGTLQARNVAETGNVFVSAGNAANVVAPGVKQSDYPNAVISALPIEAGTDVLMVEQFPTAYLTSQTSQPQYDREVWFCMPNAVKVVCDQQQQVVGPIEEV